MDQKITDLQLTMALILEERGARLGENPEKLFSAGADSISIVNTENGRNWRSRTEYFVSIDEKSNTISIDTIACVEDVNTIAGFKEGMDKNGISWWQTTTRTNERYQIIDGQMQYLKMVSRENSKSNSLDEGVSGSSHTDTETVIYELPAGYKITDGISAFTSGKAIKIAGK